MSKALLQWLATFVVLALVQVLVCNNISILNLATPFVFIYSIIRLPLTLHRNWVMTIAFLSGLIIDVFSNTQGMNALACTLVSVTRQPIIKLYVAHDDEISEPVPSAKSLGAGAYMKYLLTVTFLYCLTVTLIEAFSLHNILASIYRAVGCTILTFIILLGVDALVNARNEKL